MTQMFTPGPWHVDVEQWPECGPLVIRTADNTDICEVTGATFDEWAEIETEATAQLIAAAPDLLEVLERILSAHDRGNSGAYVGEAILCHRLAELARAAIAKAKGDPE